MKINELLNKILNKVKDTGEKVIDIQQVKDNSWFHVSDNILTDKEIFIFRSNQELLVSKNGEVSREKWEHLQHSTNSILLEIDSKAKLYNILFLSSEYLLLQQDGTENYEIFIKQQRYESKLPKELGSTSLDSVFGDLNFHLNEKNQYLLNNIVIGKPEQNIIPERNSPVTKKDSSVKDEIKREYSWRDMKLKNNRGKWGWVNPDNEMVIDFQFDEAFNFVEGLAAVIINKKRGYINEFGNYVIEPKYDPEGTYFKNGLATVFKNGKELKIDKFGNEHPLEEVYKFDYLKELEIKKNMGVINTNEQEVNFILEMQNIQDELIQLKKMCKNCKNVNSIYLDRCSICEFMIDD